MLHHSAINTAAYDSPETLCFDSQGLVRPPPHTHLFTEAGHACIFSWDSDTHLESWVWCITNTKANMCKWQLHYYCKWISSYRSRCGCTFHNHNAVSHCQLHANTKCKQKMLTTLTVSNWCWCHHLKFRSDRDKHVTLALNIPCHFNSGHPYGH